MPLWRLAEFGRQSRLSLRNSQDIAQIGNLTRAHLNRALGKPAYPFTPRLLSQFQSVRTHTLLAQDNHYAVIFGLPRQSADNSILLHPFHAHHKQGPN